MIIFDDPNETAKNAIVLSLPDPALPPVPPPPYSPRHRETDPLLAHSASRSQKEGPTWTLLWLACATCLLGGFILSLRLRQHPDDTHPAYPSPPTPQDPPGMRKCIPYRDWYPALSGSPDRFANISVPTNATRLAFESSGDLASGDMVISADPKFLGSDVLVEVLAPATQSSPAALEFANICHWRDKDGRYTVQVLAASSPELRGMLNPLNFSVVVILPNDEAAPSIPHNYADIHTNMPSFTHTIRSLEGKVRLGHVSLNTTGRPVTVNKLIASKVDISTTGAAIRGAFDVSRELVLTASNGRIDVFADITSSDNSAAPANLTLSASNGSIASVIRLHSSSWHGYGGSFNVTAHGSNASIALDVAATPIDSRLALSAKASLAPATVSLPPTFEGSFLVQSSLKGGARLRVLDVEDPAGQGRERHLEMDSVRDRHITGHLAWTLGGSPHGGVSVCSGEEASLTV